MFAGVQTGMHTVKVPLARFLHQAVLDDVEQLVCVAHRTRLLASRHDAFWRRPGTERVRTRTTFDDTHILSIERSVQRTFREVVFFTDSPGGLAFKVSLTCDDPVSTHELEEVVTTADFCIQHPRQLFLGDWKYDFARAWSAPTKSAAAVSYTHLTLPTTPYV